jgi:pimeloyl-ACP methyl ester carboxylesterase
MNLAAGLQKARRVSMAGIWLVLTWTMPVSAQERVNVNGVAMEVARAGVGGPTVVFESGLTDLSIWAAVRPAVAAFTSTIAYSHAGIGGSGPAPATRGAQQIAAELHALLRTLGAPPPYILVGHSMGGLYARAFAMQYPTEIAGLVLVDGTHERQVIEFSRLDSNFTRLRAQGLASLEPGARAEMSGLAPILEQGEPLPGQLPDVPLAVLTSTRSTPPMIRGAAAKFRALHAELVGTSTYSMHIVTSRSGHQIQRDEPDLVVGAIRWVYDAVRRQPPGAR